MALKNVTIGTTETNLYTATANTAILSIIFCNNDSTNRTINVYAMEAGAAIAPSNRIIADLQLPAKETFIWSANEKFILANTDEIAATCDTAGQVTATLTYLTL